MPYGALDESIDKLGNQWNVSALSSCLLVLGALLLVFLGYFRLTNLDISRTSLISPRRCRLEAVICFKQCCTCWVFSLGNAVKFTPEGGSIQVVLYEEPSPRGNHYIRTHLRVKDNGIGMTKEFQSKIFDLILGLALFHHLKSRIPVDGPVCPDAQRL